ncbi:MAG: (2Fe-2S) ferredoxin domain-containing protein [Clostridia bacterium]|nr:(2Fe-2S) ferredoxin domain-containing protein [Clostridia bacterium]
MIKAATHTAITPISNPIATFLFIFYPLVGFTVICRGEYSIFLKKSKESITLNSTFLLNIFEKYVTIKRKRVFTGQSLFTKTHKENIIMKVTVCIGSSCHIKGSHRVVEALQKLIAENKVGDKVTLAGTFCMGNCQQGVCVTVDEQFHSVSPETVEEFFAKEILAKV